MFFSMDPGGFYLGSVFSMDLGRSSHGSVFFFKSFSMDLGLFYDGIFYLHGFKSF